jgi:predicted flap endonuclease-1-like 5' DNA nuclease|tara:strand:+ start:2047 stop:2892 length:846 start_codon:yes stop_codon:yes gene_type:complete
MATKKSKKENKLGKARAIVKRINNDLIDASFNAIETTVKTGEKWQKLTAKLIKKTEPLTKQQINMVVETAESIKGQLENSTVRLKTLVGYDPKMVENVKKMVTEHPLVEKAEVMKDKIEKEVSNNKLVQKAEKMSAKLKKNISETIESVKGKIEGYTEEIIDDVKEKVGVVSDKKTKKTTAKKTTAKKAAPKKKAVAKKEEVIEKIIVEKTDTTNDLKVIKGIGPVLEKSLNELNITAYDQIAKMTIKDLTNLLNDAGINAKIYDLSGWKAQAELALKGAL